MAKGWSVFWDGGSRVGVGEVGGGGELERSLKKKMTGFATGIKIPYLYMNSNLVILDTLYESKK